jgi:hypothetical protein
MFLYSAVDGSEWSALRFIYIYPKYKAPTSVEVTMYLTLEYIQYFLTPAVRLAL